MSEQQKEKKNNLYPIFLIREDLQFGMVVAQFNIISKILTLQFYPY